MKLALIQFKGNCHGENDFDILVKRISRSVDSGAGIVVLPELFMHEYFCQTENADYFSLAITEEDPRIKRLQKLSGEKSFVLALPYFEKTGSGQYFNSCVVFDSGSNLGRYRKTHIPDDPGFREKFYFAGGDSGYRLFDTSCGRIGVLICFDQWFPEAARATALQGLDIILIPTAIGWDTRELAGIPAPHREIFKQEQLSAWLTIQQGHAIANGCYLASVNRVGTEGNLTFWGNSFVTGPFGKILGQGTAKEEATIMVECDFSENEKVQKTWTFFRDRRPDTYQSLTEDFSPNDPQ